MAVKYNKEEFNRFFPRGARQSKENTRRYVANYILNKGYSMKETYQIIQSIQLKS